MKTFARLGTDKPHKSPRGKIGDFENGQRPLSPSETGAAQTAQQSIDVKPDDQNTIKLADVDGAGGTPKLDNRTVPVVVARSDSKRKGRPRKSDANGLASTKLYEGLFSAIVNDSTPPLIEIRDLRENITGGEKMWTEPIHCLLCNSAIH